MTLAAGPCRGAAVLLLALALDLAVGELPARLHPVVWMGAAISWLETLAPATGRLRQLAWGAAVALLLPLASVAAALLLARAAAAAPPALGVALEALALKTTFAVRELGRAAAAVREALRGGRLAQARLGLRSLCSRDASALDAPAVAAAAVESVAENASDSAVAPLLAWALFGLPGAMAYRAVNTLDARIGYHGRHEWLGKAAARLDDLANLVPARLTAGLLLLAGALSGADARGGLRVLRRDAALTESPNAGWPMAAMAGLLGVELTKAGHYRLGDPLAPVGCDTLALAWRHVLGAVLLGAALSLGVRMVLHAG